ncbi:Dyp-type peroxidase [Streptomyces sp. NPDC004111]|uniref:Dyp-type peroxidase n=1 Tax=Streptomyces sp. NPDC004111 TaxID=3364690 RepID=UPI0036BF4B83
MPETLSEFGPARRTLLTGTAATVVTGCSAAGRRPSVGTGPAQPDAERSPAPSPFRQSGVVDPPPLRVRVLAFDLDPGLRGGPGAHRLRRLFAEWTAYGRRDERDGRSAAPAVAGASPVTVTVGIGPRTPALLGVRAPALLAELPAFPGDRLQPRRCGGDVLVQVCGDSATAVASAGQKLTRLAAGVLRARWSQPGHLPPHRPGETPRNLFGFKDGTINPTHTESERWVWVGEGPDENGTYLVVRRIHMDTPAFEALPTRRQEAVIGRTRAEGAPLGHHEEHREVDLFDKSPEGRYVLPVDAHVRQAHSRLDRGARMLRRGYSYDNGPQDRGLLFLACMNDPALFVRVQERLAVKDALSRFVEHRGSALAYVLPGPGPTGGLGDALFET